MVIMKRWLIIPVKRDVPRWCGEASKLLSPGYPLYLSGNSSNLIVLGKCYVQAWKKEKTGKNVAFIPCKNESEMLTVNCQKKKHVNGR